MSNELTEAADLDASGATPDPPHATMNGAGPEQVARALYRELQPLVKRIIRQAGGDPQQADLLEAIYPHFRVVLATHDDSCAVPLRPYLASLLPVVIEGVINGSTTEAISTRRAALRLPGVFESLSPRQQQVVALRWREHRSFEEIGALLRMSPDAARSVAARALRKLRERVARAAG